MIKTTLLQRGLACLLLGFILVGFGKDISSQTIGFLGIGFIITSIVLLITNACLYVDKNDKEKKKEKW